MRLSALVITFLFGAVAGAAGAGRVISLADAPVRISPTKQARITILAQGENAFLGKLELDPGAKIPAHRDATEEYVHVLEGRAKMTMDGKQYDIAPGTTIYMPANAEVSLENGNAKLVGLQVFAGPAPAEKYEAWTAR